MQQRTFVEISVNTSPQAVSPLVGALGSHQATETEERDDGQKERRKSKLPDGVVLLQ